jgi:hypothetical protein
MVKSVELFAAIYFTALGLSHLLQPAVWIEVFTHLRALGRGGVFLEGLMSLALGAFIVAFHPVWSGMAAFLTIVGIAQVLKGTLRLVAPAVGLRAYERASNSGAVRVGGVVGIALGVLFACIWLRS